MMVDKNQTKIWSDFKAAVNMTAASLDKWLKTSESKEVGWTHDDGKGESVGHQFGRHIVAILRKKKAELTDEDYKHMQKVAGYVSRHMAERPAGDVTATRWRYSLMNWGHDPLKKSATGKKKA